MRYLHSVIYGALERAEKNQLILRNVSKLTTLPRRTKRDIKPLTIEQLRDKLLPAIAADRFCAGIVLAFYTGLRRGELLGLRWQDIDLKGGVLHVRQTLMRIKIGNSSRLVFQEPKTPMSRRTIPLSSTCLEALNRHKAQQAQEKLLLGQGYQDQGLVFCHPDGQPLEPWNFAKRFHRMLERAGLPRIRLHDARHTFATLMLEPGESP